MATKFDFVKDINVGSEQKMWRLKARIIRIWSVPIFNDKRLIVIDQQSDRIQCTIKGHHASLFKGDLMERQTYNVASFSIAFNNGKWKPITHEFKNIFQEGNTSKVSLTFFKEQLMEFSKHDKRGNFIVIEFDDLRDRSLGSNKRKMGMKQEEECGGGCASASKQKLVFAYYVTGHGFGHATRVAEVVRHLILAGHDVHVVTAAPDFVFTNEVHSPRLFFRKVVMDCGAVQSDALTVDPLATLEKYSETAVKTRASILAKEAEWLNSINADLVVSDVVSIACRAAADAGIPSVCVANFSWDIIYLDYVMAAGLDYRSIVWQIAEDYSHCKFLIRLPGYCPMPAFRNVIDVPLVVRRLYKSVEEVREELGIADDVKLVILNFGGQPSELKLKEEFLPSGWLCLVCGASDTQNLPINFRKLPKDVYTPDIIAASDCMLGKIGYGTVSEALAYKCPFVFVRREYFNEEPFLRKMLEYYQGGVEMSRSDLLSGHWKPYLERAVSLKPCYEAGINGGEVAAQILQEIALGKDYESDKHSDAKRLRDAGVPGHQLLTAIDEDISIPEWYATAGNQLGC